jgi:hypothetical protein
MKGNKMNKLWIAASLSTAVMSAGCASSTGVLPVGPDTYSISAGASAARGGLAGARGTALKEAGEYCAKAGKQILVQDISASSSDTGRPLDISQNSNVIFRCLSEGDPELKRPNLETRPDVVIQDRR